MSKIKRIMMASLLIEKAEEMKHKRPTELGFEDLVDVVQAVVKNYAKFDPVKSSPMQYMSNCNRVEVIDQYGRTYVNKDPANKVSISVQDEGRTVKVFID